MENNEIKKIELSGKELYIYKLEAWKRLTFIADLQKEFLGPILKNVNNNKLKELIDQQGSNDFDVAALISSASALLDGNAVSKWTKRILTDGIVVYVREDGQKAKMSFSELNKFFTNPVDIISMLKEAIAFNLEGIGDVVKMFSKDKKEATENITIKETKL